jgi:hypothetical protein
VGPLALVVVSFIAFNLFGDNRKADSPPSTPPSGTHVGSHGGSSSAPANAPDGQRKAIPVPSTPADPCAAEVAVAEREVSAARVAAGHWREHVQARTALLDGRISQATTKAIWKRTRLAGPATSGAWPLQPPPISRFAAAAPTRPARPARRVGNDSPLSPTRWWPARQWPATGRPTWP